MMNREARIDPMIAKRSASGRGGYKMSAETAAATYDLVDTSNISNVFAGLPTAASVGQFKDPEGRLIRDPEENAALAAQELARMHKLTGDDSFWGQDYDEDQTGYNYANLAKSRVDPKTGDVIAGAITSGRGRAPAKIQIVGTSTTNPERPRTVAAGYDDGRNVLTVVFRDGTFYNYYTVTEEEWQAFKARWSKGQYIREVLDSKPRGTANMAGKSLVGREGLYRIARTGQWVNDGQVSAQYDRSLAPRLNPTKSRSRRK